MLSSLSTRFFTADKSLKSPTANRFGSQVARTTLARMVYRSRRSNAAEWIRDDVAVLERDGLLVIPDFLPWATFDQVADRASPFFERERPKAHRVRTGSTVLHVLRNHDLPLAREIPEFFENDRLGAILEAVERRRGVFKRAYQTIELLEQGAETGHDGETDLHSDTFYTMHKAWLYLTDVTVDSPPLAYVKRSHWLSPLVLSHIYRESYTLNRGSRRITVGELAGSGLAEEAVTCAKNTLVIANTFGYHRRLLGKPGNLRFALHVAVRDATPFSR